MDGFEEAHAAIGLAQAAHATPRRITAAARRQRRSIFPRWRSAACASRE